MPFFSINHFGIIFPCCQERVKLDSRYPEGHSLKSEWDSRLWGVALKSNKYSIDSIVALISIQIPMKVVSGGVCNEHQMPPNTRHLSHRYAITGFGKSSIPRLRDPAFWLPLASGSHTTLESNICRTLYTMCPPAFFCVTPSTRGASSLVSVARKDHNFTRRGRGNSLIQSCFGRRRDASIKMSGGTFALLQKKRMKDSQLKELRVCHLIRCLLDNHEFQIQFPPWFL